MTRSYIIWHEKIWVKYIVRAFWQMDYNMLTEYWIVKIQYCNYLHNNTIGQIIRYQDYYWSSIKLKIVEMFFVRLVDVPHGWRNRGDPNKVNEQDKRLTTQVVFTAANLKTPLTCLSCLAFLLCVRACALCLWCLSALESSWKRELQIKGWQGPLDEKLSLSNLSQSATVYLVSGRALMFEMSQGVDEAQTVEYEDAVLQGKRWNWITILW